MSRPNHRHLLFFIQLSSRLLPQSTPTPLSRKRLASQMTSVAVIWGSLAANLAVAEEPLTGHPDFNLRLSPNIPTIDATAMSRTRCQSCCCGGFPVPHAHTDDRVSRDVGTDSLTGSEPLREELMTQSEAARMRLMQLTEALS